MSLNFELSLPIAAQQTSDGLSSWARVLKQVTPRKAPISPRTARVRDFFTQFQSTPAASTPHRFHEQIEKDHGRIEHRRCYVFDQLDCLHNASQWPDLSAFVVIDSERTIKGKTTREQRYYITSLQPDAQRLAQAIRSHWTVENCLHWCMDVVFGDDQIRARTGHAAHNLSVLKHITLNLIRLDPTPRKGDIKVRRLIAATSDEYREQLFGLRR